MFGNQWTRTLDVHVTLLQVKFPFLYIEKISKFKHSISINKKLLASRSQYHVKGVVNVNAPKPWRYFFPNSKTLESFKGCYLSRQFGLATLIASSPYLRAADLHFFLPLPPLADIAPLQMLSSTL